MTRKLLDPNSLNAVPLAQDLRRALVDLWSIVSPAPVAVTAAHTVSGRVAVETLICTNTGAVTVTLNVSPFDMQEVKVKRTDAQVTIDGNGKNIDGSATLVLSAIYDAPHLVYSEDHGEWSILS